MPRTQDERSIGIETLLGKDVILLLGISAQESISDSFVYTLDVASSRMDITAKEILGSSIDFWLTLSDGSRRYFNGYVSRFSGGALKSIEYRSYQLQVVPKSWFLGKNRNFQIFPNKTVVQIIEEIFTENNIVFRKNITRTNYSVLTYAVQYQESSLAFVTRLMHEHGLFYYFEQKKGEHKLVLADNNNGYSMNTTSYDSTGAESGIYPCNSQVIQSYSEEITGHIKDWMHDSEFFSGTYTQSDFNFESPGQNLTRSSSTTVDQPGVTDNELFHYPGGFSNTTDGETYTDRRIEEQELKYAVIQASSNYRHFFPGCKFSFSSHTFDSERLDENDAEKHYAVIRLNFSITETSYFTDGSESIIYSNSFSAIPADKIYFSYNEMTKPRVYGPQTAIVVGPVDEEVYTDGYGRVKVKFHWDRAEESNESSSCWLRVSQNWAGSGWGSVALPHVGNEVIVSFVNGDPDRPIVTGRVYNFDNMPPEAPQENTEKNITQDDFGNKIILDATDSAEQILLASPVGDSKIEIGHTPDGSNDEGILLISDGDIETSVRGSNTSISSGNAYSISAGTEFSLFGGAKLDISGGIFGSLNAGLNYSVGVGGNYTYTVGYTNAWTSNSWINATNSDILNVAKEDVIIGAGDELCFVANCKDTTNERSIMYADADKISLSMGNQFKAKATGTHNTWYEAYGTASKWDVGILVGAAVSSGLAAGAFALSKTDNNKAAIGVGTGASVALLATLLAAGYEWWANNRDAAIEPIEHEKDKEALKIELNKTDGINVYSEEKPIKVLHKNDDNELNLTVKKGMVKIGREDQNSYIAIDDARDGHIFISNKKSSGGEIQLNSKENIYLQAGDGAKDVIIKSKTFNAGNLKVLA